MFPQSQPVSGSRLACLDDPLSLGCGTTSAHAGGRDGGAELEGCEVDRLVQPAGAARQVGTLDGRTLSRSGEVWILA